MSKKIAVFGCGWLGLPFAKVMLENGWKVSGSTTSNERLPTLSEAGIEAHLLELGEDGIKGDLQAFLEGAEILFINIPPGLRKNEGGSFTNKISTLIPHLQNSSLERVLFVSSTSVYGNLEGEVDEQTTPKPSTESGKQLLEAERMLSEQLSIPCDIIRYGGLIGPDRHPVKFLSGRTGLKDGGAPVNLIHLADAVRISQFIIERATEPQVYNGVAPGHPSKASYYAAEAEKRGLPAPEYISSVGGQRGKRVESRALEGAGFEFQIPLTS